MLFTVCVKPCYLDLYNYSLNCSNTGSYPPESCVFSFVLSCGAIVGELISQLGPENSECLPLHVSDVYENY